MNILTVAICRHATEGCNGLRVFAQWPIVMWTSNKRVIRLYVRALVCPSGWRTVDVTSIVTATCRSRHANGPLTACKGV